jgi:HEPN domain-containing protein
MSSKNLNKKSDNKNDKAEQQALKEVEIVAELAPNEKIGKEAEKLIETAEKLIETAENGSATTVQEQEQEAIETVLDETRRTIKKTVNEAKREIPRYTQAMGQLQEETIQATKEIGYDCIELQREAANLIPKLQERYLSYSVPWMSPQIVTEYYSRMVDNFVDNVISATNLVNSLVVFNMESIQRLADSTKEYWRVGVENAKAISRSINEQ